MIGFSVDYVVHLGNHYVEACYSDRRNRMREALKQIGISIFGGAITTLLAGIPLFFCILVFFYKFAILLYPQFFIPSTFLWCSLQLSALLLVHKEPLQISGLILKS